MFFLAIQTLLTLIVPIGSLFFVGLPIAVLLNSKKYLWVLAPFLGLAVIVLTLQNLIYLGIPITHSFYSVWLVALLLWIWIGKTNQLKQLSAPPIKLLFVAFLLYLFHSLGLLMLGAKYYMGRAWYDQFTYVSAAQFLMDHPLLHATLSDWSYQPTAIKALLFTMTNRIGEAVFQGFIACSLFTDAKTVFEPIILLLPFLLVLVIYQLAKEFLFSEKTALFLAILAATLPSMTMMHLESFISQALITPLLLLWPLILADLFESITVKKVLICILLFAVTISIYVEFAAIFFVLTCFAAVFAIFRRQQTFKQVVLVLFLLILGAFCLNVGFAKYLFVIATRAMHARGWVGIYPWANSFEGLVHLWLGDLTPVLVGWRGSFVIIISLLFLSLAYIGFGCAVYKKKNILSATLFFLILLPWFIWLRGMHYYGYQFYKLLISVCPLFPIGITLALNNVTTYSSAKRDIGYYFASFMLVITCSATLLMILMSTNEHTLAYLKRGVGYKLLNADTREVETRLSSLFGGDILIQYQDDVRQGDFINGWLSYFARHNRVWLTNPLVGDESLKPYLASTKTLPKEYLWLTTSNQAAPKSRQATKIWENKTYILWRLGRST